MILLIWAAPALLMAGFATGAARTSRTFAALCFAVAALMAVATIPSVDAGSTCELSVGCSNVASALIAAALTITAMVITHLLGRWVRDAFDRLAHTEHASHSG